MTRRTMGFTLYVTAAALVIHVASPCGAKPHSDGYHFSMQGVGVDLLWIDPDGLDSTFGFGVHPSFELYSCDWYLLPTVVYWSSSGKWEPGSPRPFITLATSVWQVELHADVHYYFEKDRIFRPYLGLSPFVYHRDLERTVTDEGEPQKSGGSSTSVGLGAKVGFEVPIGQILELSLQLRWNFLGEADLSSVSAGVSRALFSKRNP